MRERLPHLATTVLSGLIVWLMLHATRGLLLYIPWWLYIVLLTAVWFVCDYVVQAVIRYTNKTSQ